MTSDTFLGRLQDAQARPASIPPVGSSLAGDVEAGRRFADTATARRPAPCRRAWPSIRTTRSSASSGRGGMGVVYLAENRMMGRKEVLKVVSSHLLNRKGVLERFHREIRAAAQLHHPNIVTAYSATNGR